ncbi:hypothetical protein AA0111_g81 [Alternaria arborescens]|uniref:hypothetical protein n=1 Tax=Alternaria arborescens TaxID=156630 RepID=UPI00107584FE|nr:hypothetical protein AA0111_g81 [Alternaria arborescens]RYO42862.1 hypothetical protein AA0111_g81 [Alternaria arborescens]
MLRRDRRASPPTTQEKRPSMWKPCKRSYQQSPTIAMFVENVRLWSECKKVVHRDKRVETTLNYSRGYW